MAYSYSSLPTADNDDDSREGLQLRLKEQDENLDVLENSVARLGLLSLNISNEIDSQNKMLDKLEIDTDIAREKALTLTQKTAELVKKSGGPKSFCVILVLICVLIVLTLLVIYT